MSGKIHFGVYELDGDAMELRKHGVPIRLQEQPFRVLATLVERPGAIVTREELRERIWAKDTFVDFDQSLNKAVNRVREALNDDAGRPQYVETIPRRGYRFVAPVTKDVFTELPGSVTPAGAPSELQSTKPVTPVPRLGKIHALTLACALVLLAVAVALWPRKSPRVVPSLQVRHMTSGGSGPALSKDGKLLAYVSNAGSNVMHIWVKQTAGGPPIPITSGPDADCCVEFSPDGTRIAFSSARARGGLFVAPTLSGEPRLLVQGSGSAITPHFSPDGDRILYLQDGSPFIVPSDGGTPVALPLPEDFKVRGASPLWAPSGDEIILYGSKSRERQEADRWWIVPLTGGQPRLARLPGWESDETSVPTVRAWSRTKDGRFWIVYSVSTGSAWKLFRVETSKHGEASPEAEELVSGTGLVGDVSFSEDGKLAYTTFSFGGSIFEIPINDQGRKAGPTVQLPFSDEGHYSAPSVSRDGRWLVYGGHSLDKPRAIMLRDLRTGVDHFLDEKANPRDDGADTSISPDGSKVLFVRPCPEGKWPNGDPIGCTFMLSTRGGQPEQVCEACDPRGFSSDGSVVLVQKYLIQKFHPFANGWAKIVRLDLATKKEEDLLTLPDRNLFHAFYSWDDHWVVFKKLNPEPTHVAQILIAPVRRGVAGKPAEWIAVTDGLHDDDKPQFSADGNTVYFTSTRDGYLCIWAQKLDPVTKHPVDPPFGFEHFHNSAGRDGALPLATIGWDLTVARDKVLINLPRISADVWMVQVE